MNNFNYLLLIIFIILLIFNLYINYNINFEFFQQLPEADLGPIKFIDYDTKEELGRYPSNWNESELYKKNTTLEPTIIKIRRGPRGYKGKTGTAGSPGKCEGIININSIVGDNLEIASDNFRILSDNVKFKNKLCFGDDEKACLNKNLINKIKYNKTIENERNLYKNRVDTGFYVLKTVKDLETRRANTAEENRDKYKEAYETCNALIKNTDKYVTRETCNNELTAKDTYWSAIHDPIQTQNNKRLNEIRRLTGLLNDEKRKIDTTLTPRVHYTKKEYDDIVNRLNTCTKKVGDFQDSDNNYKNNWVKRGQASYNDLSPDQKRRYGEKLDINDVSITGRDDLYIKKSKCEWIIAKDKNDYGKKVNHLKDYDTSGMYNPRWGLITPSNTSEKGLYGKIGTAIGEYGKIGDYGKITDKNGDSKLYIKKSECTYDIATDKRNYGKIGTSIGEYGKIGEYGRIKDDMGDGLGEYCSLRLCGKIGTENNEYGLIGDKSANYIIRSEYNKVNDALEQCQKKTDMSNLTSINSTSPNKDLSIKGNNLEFHGDTVTFNNELCIRPDRGNKICLTEETIKEMNNSPYGQQGAPGICKTN